jgi:glutaminyl-peptide cyclotransferase
MLRTQGILIAIFAVAVSAANFSGALAYEFTKRAVAFGPRPPGSMANRELQDYIRADLKTRGCQISEDAFLAKTPKGDFPMRNILCKFKGTSGRAIVITGHFDTKLFPGRKFVGANDGGSSTGLLLELAHALQGETRKDDVYVVFLDGEEATREQWEGEDNLYGSRHLAETWRKDGTLRQIKALINVDMIGDKNLNVNQEMESTAFLRQLVFNAANDLGYKAYFSGQQVHEEDDHIPFLKLGVPALDVIDVEYDPWHKDSDTMDKVSAQSLDIVGTVMQESIHRLERQ